MENKTIAVLEELFKAGKIKKDHIHRLQLDERKGVQKLIKAYEHKQHKQRKHEEMFTRMSTYEQKNYTKGHEYIAGIDEAGRGPLAGPVVAASVILPTGFKLLGLTDSKKLNEQTRNKFYKQIINQAVSYGIAVNSNEQIDQINIYEATKRAMRDSLSTLDIEPDHVLIDAVRLENLPFTSEVITKGDERSITIAAASILAKVTRDKLMKDIHAEYPIYKFSSNKGYGTKHHLDMLMQHGATPHHRKSYTPVRNSIN